VLGAAAITVVAAKIVTPGRARPFLPRALERSSGKTAWGPGEMGWSIPGIHSPRARGREPLLATAFSVTGIVKNRRGFRLAGAIRPAIRNCSTGWPPSSSGHTGTSKAMQRLMLTSAYVPPILARDAGTA